MKNGSHFFVSLTGSLNADSFAQTYQPVTVSASGARGRVASVTEKYDLGSLSLVGHNNTSLNSTPSTSTNGNNHYPLPPPPLNYLNGADSNSNFSSLTGMGQSHAATTAAGSTSDKRSRSGSILFGGQALTLPPPSTAGARTAGGYNSEFSSPPTSARDRSGTRSRASSTASVVFSPSSRTNSSTNFYDHTTKSSATSSSRSR